MSTKRLPSIISTVALVCGLHTPAAAGVVISGDYYEQTSYSQNCSLSTSCRVNLTPIPEDKILDLNQINCVVFTNKSIFIFQMGATSSVSSATLRPMFFAPQFIGTSGGYQYYTIEREINYRMGSSRHLYFEVNIAENGNSTLQCTITGKLSPR